MINFPTPGSIAGLINRAVNIGITGVTGFIGRRIARMAFERGHSVTGFSRNPSQLVPGCSLMRAFRVNEKPDLSGCDALIHLAGESVFGVWTHEKKRRILESRQIGTRQLVDAILTSEKPPRVLVSGSAIGFYGDTGETVTDEDSPAGEGFLAETTRLWESEARRAEGAGMRVVLLRTGLVLGEKGGAMRIMKPIFLAGFGGKIGLGTQWMSWIHLDDMASLALLAVENEILNGPINAVAPEPVRNVNFTHTLAGVVRRPALFTVPRFVLKIGLGEFSRELLDSKRIISARAQVAGFRPKFADLEAALKNVIEPTKGGLYPV